MIVIPTRNEAPDMWRDLLGATDVAAILGESPFASAHSVWLEKTGQAPLQAPTRQMKRGTRLENFVAMQYQDDTGSKLKPAPAMLHPKYGFLAASPDFHREYDPLVVETKTHPPWHKVRYGEPGTDAVPSHELVQCLWQMHVGLLSDMGWNQADLVVQWDFDNQTVFHIAYDYDLGGRIEEQMVRWWRDHVTKGVEPMVGGSDCDLDWIKERFPKEEVPEIRATTEVAGWLRQLLAVRAEKAEKEAAENALKARIQQYMGGAAVLITPGFDPVTWKKTADVLVKEHVRKGARRFLVPGSKEA